MAEPSPMKLREAKAFTSFASSADTERAVDARSYHIARFYDDEDFSDLLSILDQTDSTASIAFLGRDAIERAATMEQVHGAGHELALHGHRHVKFGDLEYETAHGDLETGMRAIEDATGLRATGFFAPFKGVSGGTVRAATELGLDWILGNPSSDVATDVPIVDSVYPHDTRLLEAGTSPGDTFSELSEETQAGSTFLFHPNLLDYYSALEEFEAWLEEISPVSVSEGLAGGGVSIILDCLSPIRMR